MRRRLPLGIQTFRKLREESAYYVDKTPGIKLLVDSGSYYFLSRPRRFGKSLLLDTIKELFEGNEALFRGLAIEGDWDWSVRHPVVRLDFAGGSYGTPEDLRAGLAVQFDELEAAHGIEKRYERPADRFRSLVWTLHQQTGQRVVVLVDEYDKPILDTLAKPEVAIAHREALRGFYGVIKASDAAIRFAMLTGVSKFTKVSLFSELNNLTDITLDSRYGDICGYREEDLDTVFAPELEGLDREKVRDWYNGYSWGGGKRVYNPYGLLRLFDSRKFSGHWFETGTPKFLVETLIERGVSSVSLDGTLSTESLLSVFDVEEIGTEALLFQTGYLTIAEEKTRAGQTTYRLGYPNREVRQALNEHLLTGLVRNPAKQDANSERLARLLESHDCAGLEELFHAFFASIPYEWYTKNDIARYEGYYASVFYSYFAALGYEVTVEDSSNQGRLDMAVRAGGHVYLFEFKVVEQASPGAALQQLRDRDYAAKYRGSGEPIHLVGVEFSSETRNITAFEVA